MSEKPTLISAIGNICPTVRGVLLLAKAIDVKLDMKFIDITKREQHEPWFLALNPQHTIPTLIATDGRALWDSHAICTYLIRQYGGNLNDDHPLYPHDAYTRARIDQRLFSDATAVFPAIKAIAEDVLMHGAWEVNEREVEATNAAYTLVESFLSHGDDYVAASTLTLADFTLVGIVTALRSQVGLDAVKFPKIQAWIERLEQLPYYKETSGEGLANFVVVLNDSRKRNKEANESM